MTRALPLKGFRGFLLALVAVVVFPLLWLRAVRFARSQRDVDPRAPAKVGIAILASIAILVTGAGAAYTFRESSLDGIYSNLEARLVAATGEGEYRENRDLIPAKEETMARAAGNVEAAMASYDQAGATGVDAEEALWEDYRALHVLRMEALEAATPAEQQAYDEAAASGGGDGELRPLLRRAGSEERYDELVASIEAQSDALGIEANPEAFVAHFTGRLGAGPAADAVQRAFGLQAAANSARADRAASLGRVEALDANHRFFESELAPALRERDDEALAAAIAGTSITYTSAGSDLAANGESALRLKHEAKREMDSMLLVWVYPSLAGAFLAPVVFALGSILRAGFVPSDTVGFKPYPSAAMGWFLLFGGFGIPSIPFAAWAVKDIENRAAEGQIAL